MKLVVLVDGGFRGALGVHHGGVICGTRRPVIKDISVRRFLRPRAARAATALCRETPDLQAAKDLACPRAWSGLAGAAWHRRRLTSVDGSGSPWAGKARRNWPFP